MRVYELTQVIQERLVELGMSVVDDASQSGGRPVADLVVSDPAGGVHVVEVKAETRRQVDVDHREMLRQAEAVEAGRGVILGLPYVTDRRGEVLRGLGVSYVDASGNAHVEGLGVYVHVEGRPRSEAAAPSPKRTAGWAARPSGLRVLLHLLTLEGLVSEPMTRVAAVCGVSNATVHGVLRDLVERGVLSDAKAGRVWVDLGAAVDMWIDGHVNRVVPAMDESPRMARDSVTDIAEAIASEPNVWVTGAAALERYAGGIQSPTATVYAQLPFPWGIGEVRLRPVVATDHTPDVIFREALWLPGTYPAGVVPLLLAYADAIATADPRVIEAAKEVAQSDEKLRSLLRRST